VRAAISPVGYLLTAVAAAAVACGPSDTSRLTPQLEQRLAAETLVVRLDNVLIRRSHDVGRSDAGYREGVASVLVTKRSVLIHRNGEIGFEISERSRRDLEVHRRADRVRINSGSGASTEVWSFAVRGDSAEAVTQAIRDVIGRTQAAPAR